MLHRIYIGFLHSKVNTAIIKTIPAQNANYERKKITFFCSDCINVLN